MSNIENEVEFILGLQVYKKDGKCEGKHYIVSRSMEEEDFNNDEELQSFLNTYLKAFSGQVWDKLITNRAAIYSQDFLQYIEDLPTWFIIEDIERLKRSLSQYQEELERRGALSDV